MNTWVSLDPEQVRLLKYIQKCIKPHINFIRTALKCLVDLNQDDRDCILMSLDDEDLRRFVKKLNPHDQMIFMKQPMDQNNKLRLIDLGLLQMDGKWGEFYLTRANRDPEFKQALDIFVKDLPSKIQQQLTEFERLYPTIAASSH